MPWHVNFPVGNISVKANRSIGNQNMEYIQKTMGFSPIGTNAVTTRDHFWNVGGNEDGRHRFFQSPAFVDVGGNPTDPVIGTGMKGVFYLKTIQNRVEGFYRNAQGVYQVFPAVKTGSVVIAGNNLQTITDIPANSYGEIFLWYDAFGDVIQQGVFASNATHVRAYSCRQKIHNTSNNYILELKNDRSSNLNLQVKQGDDGPHDGSWSYIITYRAK